MTSGDSIRLLLILEYDGSRFFGWQIQPERRTVQGVVQAAAERLTDGPCTLTGSGRTDRGVHATGQAASVTVPPSWSPEGFRESMNAVLPDDVWVREAERVPEGFHPRYHAVARTYRYRVGLAEAAQSPFHRPFCWPLDVELDRALLDRCAAAVPGERSFEAFAKSGQPQRGTRCHVHRASWEPWESLGLVFSVTANRYLHHMVRYLVGTMVDVGRGRRPPSEMETLLADGPGPDLWTSPPAPPRGLYLHRVEYPTEALRPEAAGADTDPTKLEGRPSGVPEERTHR